MSDQENDSEPFRIPPDDVRLTDKELVQLDDLLNALQREVANLDRQRQEYVSAINQITIRTSLYTRRLAARKRDEIETKRLEVKKDEKPKRTRKPRRTNNKSKTAATTAESE